jgi:uncharacterized protein YukE
MPVALGAVEEAAALPGGQPFAGIAAQLNGDSAAIGDIADNWQQSAQSGQEHTTAVSNAVDQVTTDWKGTAQEGFTDLMGQFAAASRNVQEPLLVGSKALTSAANTIEAAQKTVEGICERLLSYVSQVQSLGTANQAKPSAIQAAIKTAVSEAVSEAQTACNQANTALSQVSTTLSNALAAMGEGTFSSLPTPGANASDPGSTGSGPQLSSSDGGPSGGSSGGGGGAAGSGGAGGSGGGGGGSGTTVTDGGGGTPAAPGQVDEWIQEAIKVLEAHGVPASELNAQDIWIIIEHESGGNPDAINLTDSNAAAGDPSQGLMQTIPSTFSAYALPGYNSSITNPVDNIIAGVRYAIGRYGSLSNVPGVIAVNNGDAYVGY